MVEEETQVKRPWVRIPPPDTGWSFFQIKDVGIVCLKKTENKIDESEMDHQGKP